MAMRHRLSSIVCQELAEAKYRNQRLGRLMDKALSDGEVTAEEMRDILREKAELDREMDEAVVAAESHDLVLATFEYALRAGPDAPPHKFLRQKQEDVWRLAEAQRKAPTAAVKRVRRGNERSG